MTRPNSNPNFNSRSFPGLSQFYLSQFYSLAQLLMGSQSTAKTIFLLAAMVGWLIVGAALMYLFPVIADWLVASERTHLWMTNLSRGGYNPMLAWVGGGITLAITVLAHIIWHQRFEGKI